MTDELRFDRLHQRTSGRNSGSLRRNSRRNQGLLPHFGALQPRHSLTPYSIHLRFPSYDLERFREDRNDFEKFDWIDGRFSGGVPERRTEGGPECWMGRRLYEGGTNENGGRGDEEGGQVGQRGESFLFSSSFHSEEELKSHLHSIDGSTSDSISHPPSTIIFTQISLFYDSFGIMFHH